MMMLTHFVLSAFGGDFVAERIVERLVGRFGYVFREAAAIVSVRKDRSVIAAS